MKRSNHSSNELVGKAAESLIFLSNNPRESFFGLEEHDVGEKIRDPSSKTDKQVLENLYNL